MTIKKLALLICKKEGKKIGVNIAQVNEIIGVLSDIVFKKHTKNKFYTQYAYDFEIFFTLLENGNNRALKKLKKKR